MFIRRFCRRLSCSRLILYLLLFFLLSIIMHVIYKLDLSNVSNPRSIVFIVDSTDLTESQIKVSMKNVQLIPEEYFDKTNLTCPYPKLSIDNPEVWTYLNPVRRSKPECEKSTNWVYVENGQCSKKSNRDLTLF